MKLLTQTSKAMAHLPGTVVGILAVACAPVFAAQLTVKATNNLDVPRKSQTLEISAAQLAPLGAKELNLIHVKDSQGAEVICQAVDTDFDAYHKPDMVVFQSDFGSKETRSFTISVGSKQVFKKDQFRAFGRFVRERFDDFAWENDLIAHRMYGKGLETWAGEPLTSSTVDIWSKRIPRMVVNDWYLADDYHADYGEGADFYSAGPSRGCGGSGVWEADKLWTSRNFLNSRVLANGPIRVLFELDYEAFDVNGKKLRETKRISLDAGSHLDRFQSTFKWEGNAADSAPVVGIGLKKNSGAKRTFNASAGFLSVWEKMAKNAGMQGLGAIVSPGDLQGEQEDKLNYLVLAKSKPDLVITYWAGFCWDKAGTITTPEAWDAYLTAYAQRLGSPIELTVSTEGE